MPMNARLLRPRASGLNPDAIAWRNAVFAAGSSVSGSVVSAVSGFITGCQSDGIWDAMKSVVLLAGADTLAGALAPMKGTAPTSYNFASGDYNKASGLKGNGSSTYLDSNRSSTADPADSFHCGAYLTFANNVGGSLIQDVGGATAGSSYLLFSPNNYRARGSANYTRTSVGTGYVGMNVSGTTLTHRAASANATQTISPTQATGNLFVFAGQGPTNYSLARISFYSIGEVVDVALLDARVSALMTAIGVS